MNLDCEKEWTQLCNIECPDLLDQLPLVFAPYVIKGGALSDIRPLSLQGIAFYVSVSPKIVGHAKKS
jgi:hypothetical protein